MSWRSTRTPTRYSSTNEEAVLGLTWTGGVVELATSGDGRHEYIVPEDGTLYWMDTWVIFEDAPHPTGGATRS